MFANLLTAVARLCTFGAQSLVLLPADRADFIHAVVIVAAAPAAAPASGAADWG